MAKVTGLTLIAGSAVWAAVATVELASFSPVLWQLLLPRLVLTGVPAAAGAATGTALLRGQRRAAAYFAIALALTLLQAAALTLLSPLPLR